ncbi:MAG: tRNA pseudouridine(13) synthase TruD [Planctomycetota bacterium]
MPAARYDAPADQERLGIAARVPRLTDATRPQASLKSTPEDFRVTEIPAYETCGHGEHLFLNIEKRDLSHERAIDLLARTLGVKKADVGTAGMKDRRAVTRQFVSIPAETEDQLERLTGLEFDDGSYVRLLGKDRHTNKLKTGHLRGNRFEIVARTEVPVDVDAFGPTAEAVRRVGFPNAFGAQRFGDRGSTLALGLNLLTGEADVRDIPPRRRKFLSRLALSAAQSAVFNHVLAARVRGDAVATVLPGDVLRKRPSGGVFVAADVAAEQARVDAGETAVTGPLPGPSMTSPTGPAADLESEALDAFGLAPEMFGKFPKLAPGARRPLTVIPGDLAIGPVDGGVRFSFTLPAGAYATTLLDQFVAAPDAAK